MRRILFLVFALTAFYGLLHAQTSQCGSRLAPPEIRAEVEAQLAQRKGEEDARITAQMHYIPVVVHVVYNTQAQNLSDAVVQSYLDDLNSAFRKMRTPPFTPRIIFDSLWADMEVAFCLATQDPSGAPTTGITHTQTSTFFGGNNEDVKHTSTGGKDAWPTSSYLNIWIAPLGNGQLGYAANNNVYNVPGAVEGVVVSSSFPLLLGNVLAHEAGHFVGLLHTFDNAAELVGDTPWEGTGGHLYLNRVGNSCASGDLDSNTSITEESFWTGKNPPDMIENFMGYNRPCQFMFTKGQVTRARAILSQYYPALTKTSCAAMNVADVASNDAHNFILYYDAGAAFAMLRSGGKPMKYTVQRADGSVAMKGSLQAGSRLSFDGLPQGVYVMRAGNTVRKLVVH